jgi:hypothetical protein
MSSTGTLVGSSQPASLPRLQTDHQHAEELVAHAAPLGGLEQVHQREAALADGRVDGHAHNDGDQQEHIVEVQRVGLHRGVVEQALVQRRNSREHASLGRASRLI